MSLLPISRMTPSSTGAYSTAWSRYGVPAATDRAEKRRTSESVTGPDHSEDRVTMTTTARMAMFAPIANASREARTRAVRSSKRSRGLDRTVNRSIPSGIGTSPIELDDRKRMRGPPEGLVGSAPTRRLYVPGAEHCLSRTHLRIARAGVRSITGRWTPDRMWLCGARFQDLEVWLRISPQSLPVPLRSEHRRWCRVAECCQGRAARRSPLGFRALEQGTMSLIQSLRRAAASVTKA